MKLIIKLIVINFPFDIQFSTFSLNFFFNSKFFLISYLRIGKINLFFYSSLIGRQQFFVCTYFTYLYSSILPDHNAEIFATFLQLSYCSFSSLILSSSIMVSFNNFSKRFCLKCKVLSDSRVVSITKKEHGFVLHFFVKIHKVSKVNI